MSLTEKLKQNILKWQIHIRKVLDSSWQVIASLGKSCQAAIISIWVPTLEQWIDFSFRSKWKCKSYVEAFVLFYSFCSTWLTSLSSSLLFCYETLLIVYTFTYFLSWLHYKNRIEEWIHTSAFRYPHMLIIILTHTLGNVVNCQVNK